MPDHENKLIRPSDEVARAFSEKRPVVALESTIVTHGMPWPRNFETARQVENDIREHGAVPATIAVFDGHIHIGLNNDQLTFLAKAKDVMKLSRADLAFALAADRIGSTTVAATMMAAELAGIEVFATGGIGGVHQGAETSFDISADLPELGRTNVITVCAGAKAILDINKTLEVLETEGVPVISFQSDQVPAFWSCESGIPTPLRMDSTDEIASLWKARREINQDGGVLIANPVPKIDEIPRDEMAQYINAAVEAADKEGIHGKAVTPWLLAHLLEITEGRSLTTNIALIRSNARLAAQIAIALAK